MSEPVTELDRLIAQQAGELSPAFFDRFLSSELFVKASGERPQLLALSEGEIVIAFDLEERLGAFAPEGSDYLTLSGRALVDLLAGKQIGIGLNLMQSDQAVIVPADAISWLAQNASGPTEDHKAIAALLPPKGFPEGFLQILSEKITAFAGMAAGAGFAQAQGKDDSQFLVLGVFGAQAALHEPFAKSISETVQLQFDEGSELQVMFLEAGDPIADNFKSVGWWIDWPEAQKPSFGVNIGDDPQRPPKLR